MSASDFFALVALIVSCAAFYFQFFYKRDSIVCTLENWSTTANSLSLRLSISNPGTRLVLLKEASLSLLFLEPGGSGIGFAVTNHEKKFHGLLIPKDEIVIISVDLPISKDSISKARHHHEKHDYLGKGDGWPIWLSLSFLTVSGRRLSVSDVAIHAEWFESGGCKVVLPNPKVWHLGEPTFEQDRPII